MAALLVRSAVAQNERDPVRGGDKLDAGDAVFEYPLRPARGAEDGALRLGVAVEPRLVGGTACVSAELQRLADGRLDLAIGASVALRRHRTTTAQFAARSRTRAG